MIVLDASAVVDWLLQSAAGQRIEKRIFSAGETLHAPHLLDLEVTQVLRRLAQQRNISDQRANAALQVLLDLRIARYPHAVFLPRIWQLRHHLSAYDSAYIALTEQLSATLITRDTRMALAVGHSAQIEVF